MKEWNETCVIFIKTASYLIFFLQFQCPIFAPKPVSTTVKSKRIQKSERAPKRRKLSDSSEHVGEEKSDAYEPKRRSCRLQGKVG